MFETTDPLTVLGMVVALIGTGGIGYIFKTWSDNRRQGKADTNSALLAFTDRTTARIESLERQLQAERAHCDAKLTTQGAMFEAKLNYELHKARNASDRESKLLWTLKIAPERVSEAIPEIERLKREHQKLETMERVGLAALGITIEEPVSEGEKE